TYLSAQSENGESAPSMDIDLSWLDSIWLKEADLNLPYLAPQHLWDAIVRVHPDGDALELEASLLSRGQREAPILKIQAEASIRSRSIKKMEAVLNRFPAEIFGTTEASMTVDGLLTAESDSNGDFACGGRLAFNEVDLSFPSISSLHLPSATLSLQAHVSSRFDLKRATGEVCHASFDFSDISGRIFVVPSGEMRLSLKGDNTSLSDLEIEGFCSILDRYSLRLNSFSMSASSMWKAAYEVKERTIQNVISYLPPEFASVFKDLHGTVDISGNFEGDQDGMKTFSAEAALRRGRTAYGNVQIEDASSVIRISGDDEKGRAELWGEMKAALAAFGEKTLVFEPDFQAIGWFDLDTREYEFQLAQVHAEMVQDVSGWIRSGNQWRVEGEIPLEEGAKSLRDILPEWGKDLEGMGSVRLQLDGGPDFIAGDAFSPDFMIYSFSDDYAYGLQWRDVHGKAKYDYKDAPIFRGEIEASTPYVTYDSHEYEWPDKSLRLRWEAGETHLACEFHPPGGGIIHLAGQQGDSYSIQAAGLDIRSFLAPVLQHFALGQNEEDFGSFKVAGTANADLFLQWEGGRTRLDGVADLFLKSLEMDYAASGLIQNARIRIPVVFPLSYESFRNKKLDVSFEKSFFEGVEFKNITFSLPLHSKSIELISSLSLPIFGGEILIRDLRVKNWLSAEAEAAGSIHFSEVQLEEVNPILPIVPKEGSL
ncbi:MAG: hypothetical protein ACP5I1_15770, partial [Candidatus Hinthialibacter sp.]